MRPLKRRPRNKARGGPMRARQSLWTANAGWTGHSDGPADLCLAFGGTGPITDKWNELSRRHPGAILLGCSTGGEIHGADVLDESLSVTALGFERTKLKSAEAFVETAGDSYQAGKEIGRSLARPELKTIFLLSAGTGAKGSDAIPGVRSCRGKQR